MADKQGIIDLVLSYIPDGQKTNAKPVIGSLVSPAVESIGGQYRWNYLKRTHDFTVAADSAVYEMPTNMGTIIRMGTLTDGFITRRYYPYGEVALIDGYDSFSGSYVHYIPLTRNQASLNKQRILIKPGPGSSETAQVLYFAKPSGDDIALINNSLMIAFKILSIMPNALITFDPKTTINGYYYKLFDNELTNEVSRDEESREISFNLGQDDRAASANREINKL